jgi:dienelactone hydrolase
MFDRTPSILFQALAVMSLLIIFGGYSIAGVDDPTRGTAYRIEVIPIETITISDEQFLEGEPGGTPTTIAGVLRIPRSTGRTPLVIFIAGSGGFNGSIDVLDRQFGQMGISTFSLDGFAGRGIANTVTDQSQLGRLNMIVDLYRSLAVLARHRLIDSSRIAVMGFSRGGQIALYSSLKRFQQLWNSSHVEIAAYISFFGPCNTTFIGDSNVSGRPIRLFHGTLDDYVEVAPCRKYVQRLKDAGSDVKLTEYADAWHGFNYAAFSSSSGPVVVRNGETNHCQLTEEPQGSILNVETGRPFSARDKCVGRNPHVLYSTSATHDADESVKALLRSVFALPPD